MNNTRLEFENERLQVELFVRIPNVEWATFKALPVDMTHKQWKGCKKLQIFMSQLILSMQPLVFF